MPLFALCLLILGLGISIWRLTRRYGQQHRAITPLRFLPLPLVGLALQFVALRWAGGAERLALFAISQLVLIVFLGANFQFLPLRLLALGFALNLLPILFNNGYMPISPEAMASLHPGTAAAQWASGLVRAGSKDIVLATAAAPFWFLGDVFVVGYPFPLPTAFSLGDVNLLVGFGWALYEFSWLIGVQNDQSHRVGTLAERRGSRPAV